MAFALLQHQQEGFFLVSTSLVVMVATKFNSAWVPIKKYNEERSGLKKIKSEHCAKGNFLRLCEEQRRTKTQIGKSQILQRKTTNNIGNMMADKFIKSLCGCITHIF